MASDAENNDFVERTRRIIELNGAASFVVDDLTLDDLEDVWWTGNPSHIKNIEATLKRVATGEAEYLAVRAPSGTPLAVGKISYETHEGAGMLSQLVTHWLLQGHGLGTRLIDGAERRIAQRGLTRAVIGVEEENVRARALYERLGYKWFGHEQDSWENQREDGSSYLHVAECALLEKYLSLTAKPIDP